MTTPVSMHPLTLVSSLFAVVSAADSPRLCPWGGEPKSRAPDPGFGVCANRHRLWYTKSQSGICGSALGTLRHEC
jgi:hypothetical protein